MHAFKVFFYLVGPMWPLLQLKRGCLGMGHIQLKTPGPGLGPLEGWTAVEDRKQRRRTDCSTNVSIFSWTTFSMPATPNSFSQLHKKWSYRGRTLIHFNHFLSSTSIFYVLYYVIVYSLFFLFGYLCFCLLYMGLELTHPCTLHMFPTRWSTAQDGHLFVHYSLNRKIINSREIWVG